MLFYWFIYDSTGAIYWLPVLATSNPWTNPPASLTVVSFAQDTASSDVQGAYLNPSRYLMQGSPVAPVLQPYLTAAYASGTLTVTVQNPPATPPTDATVTLGASTETVALTSNTGTLALAVHPSLATYSLPVQVTATGCVAWSGDVGTPGQSAPVALQIYTASGGALTVGPQGQGSQAFLQEYRLGGLPPQTVFQDLLVVVSAMAHVLTHDLIPQATATTWAAVAVDASALTDWQTNVQPSLPVTLSNSLTMPQYAELKARIAGYQQAANGYAADVNEIPNLA